MNKVTVKIASLPHCFVVERPAKYTFDFTAVGVDVIQHGWFMLTPGEWCVTLLVRRGKLKIHVARVA